MTRVPSFYGAKAQLTRGADKISIIVSNMLKIIKAYFY